MLGGTSSVDDTERISNGGTYTYSEAVTIGVAYSPEESDEVTELTPAEIEIPIITDNEDEIEE